MLLCCATEWSPSESWWNMGTIGKALRTHLQKYQIHIKRNLSKLCFDCWKQRYTQGPRWLMYCTLLLWSTKPQSLSSSETTKWVDYTMPYRIDFKCKGANIADTLSELANSLGFWSLAIGLLWRITLQYFHSARGFKLVSKTIERASLVAQWLRICLLMQGDRKSVV